MSCYKNKPKQTYENSIEVLSAIFPKVFNWDEQMYIYNMYVYSCTYMYGHIIMKYIYTQHEFNIYETIK